MSQPLLSKPKPSHSPVLIHPPANPAAELEKLIELITKNQTLPLESTSSRVSSLSIPSDPAKSISFSPDGQRIATVSKDKLIRVWSVLHNSLLNVLTGHSGTVNCAVFGPIDNTLKLDWLASGSNDKTILIWDLTRSSIAHCLENHTSHVYSLGLNRSGSMLASGSDDKTIKLWNAGNFCEESTSFEVHYSVFCVAFSKDNQFLAVGSEDNSIKVFDTLKKIEEKGIFTNSYNIKSLCFTPNGKFLVSLAYKGNPKVWDWKTRELAFEFVENSSSVCNVSVSYDGRFLACNGFGPNIKIWDLDERHEFFVLVGHEEVVKEVKFSPSQNVLVSCCENSELKTWDFRNKIDECRVKTESGLTSQLLETLSYDLITGFSIHIEEQDNSCLIHVFKPDGSEQQIQAKHDKITNVQVSCNGKFLAYIGHKLYLYSLENNKTLPFINSAENPSLIKFGNKSNVLAFANKSFLGLYEINNNKTVKLSSHIQNRSCFSFDSEDSMLGSGDKSGLVTVWKISGTRKYEQCSFCYDSSTVHALEFISQDWLASAYSYSIVIWNIKLHRFEYLIQSPKSIRSLEYNNGDLTGTSRSGSTLSWNLNQNSYVFSQHGHFSTVSSTAFSANGEYLFSGSYDKSIKVWNLKQKREEKTLSEIGSEIHKICFLDKEKILIVACSAGVVVWAVEEGVQRQKIETDGKVYSVKVSLDNREFVIGCENGSVIRYSLEGFVKTAELVGHQDVVFDTAFDCSKTFLASGSRDCSVKIWVLASNTLHETLDYMKSPVYTIVFHPIYANRLLAGCKDGKIHVFDNFISTLQVQAHVQEIFCLIFTLDGEFLVSAGEDCSIKLWTDLQLAAPYIEIPCKPVFSLSSSLSLLAAGFCDSSISVYSLQDYTETLRIPGHTQKLSKIYFSTDGKLSAQSSTSGLTLLKNSELSTSKEFTESSFINSICFSHTNKYIFTATGHTIKIWEINGTLKKPVNQLKGFQLVVHMALSPNDKFLVTQGSDDSVCVWEFNADGEGTYRILSAHGFKYSDWTATFSINSDCVVMISDTSSQVLELNNKKTSRSQVELGPISSLLLMDQILNDPYSDFMSLYNLVYALQTERSERISCSSLKTFIGVNRFSFLHILAGLGKANTLEQLCEKFIPILTPDNYEKSPLYYSIHNRQQKCTDILLGHLVKLTQIADRSSVFLSFNAIKHDLMQIIQDSPPFLSSFLSQCVYTWQSYEFTGDSNELPLIRMTDSFTGQAEDFNLELKPMKKTRLIIKTIPIQLQAVTGSKMSLELLEEMLRCKNSEIFRTETIQFFIKTRWGALKNWVYLLTALFWANLFFFTMTLVELSWWYYVPMLIINFALILFEVFQNIYSASSYFKDWWNIIDFLRWTFSLIWLILRFFDINSTNLTWFTMLLNLLRGLTGFRAFGLTRYYIRLIFSSFGSITSFLLIYIYTTLAFGLLSLCATQEIDIDFRGVWVNPFVLILGETENMISTEANLKFLTFFMAVMINLVIMLNMIISIISDSFDEFQLSYEIYDFKEMTEVIVEIEQVISLFKPLDKTKFIQICDYEYGSSNKKWKGKVLEVTQQFDELAESLVRERKENGEGIARLEAKCTEKFKEIDKNVAMVNDKLEKIIQLISKG